jgi:F-type H+-transporting ATPase subunit epsilon
MATFHFDLVSPERLFYSGQVEQVDVPGSEGEFGVLAGHAPLVAIVKPGILTIKNGGETQRVVVLGGFAEVSPSGLTVLADVATTVEDFDHAALEAQIKAAEEKIAKMEQDSQLAREIERLDHFRTLRMQLTGTAMH